MCVCMHVCVHACVCHLEVGGLPARAAAAVTTFEVAPEHVRVCVCLRVCVCVFLCVVCILYGCLLCG